MVSRIHPIRYWKIYNPFSIHLHAGWSENYQSNQISVKSTHQTKLCLFLEKDGIGGSIHVAERLAEDIDYTRVDLIMQMENGTL